MNNLYLNKNEFYLQNLTKFFAKIDESQINQIQNIVNRKSKISLRMIEWFVSKYCKQNSLPNKKDGLFINIYNSYTVKIKISEKKYFDPFKRYEIIEFTFYNGITINTTIPQLNFFKWIFENNILIYIENNYDELFKLMGLYNIENTQQRLKKKNQKDIMSLNINNIKTKINKDTQSLSSVKSDEKSFIVEFK